MVNLAHGSVDYAQLKADIQDWGRELGFQAVGVADTRLAQAEQHLLRWLRKGHHGTMHYMARHGVKRARPARLTPGTVRVISVRMDYDPPARPLPEVLSDPERACVSRYALGRDYHKVLRRRLQKLADRIEQAVGSFGYRVLVDSAPVLEKALAEKAGLGWIGKHTNLLNDRAGSWFFLGELYTDLPLPVDRAPPNRCGNCRRCLTACPTNAIVGPYQVDARRCISYLTIELKGSIPEPLRAALGNRIYGCDDCQLVCPWNRFSETTEESDFWPRHKLDDVTLVELFGWSEEQFLKRMAGSPIRRIGHQRWLRNIAVALGNAPGTPAVLQALEMRREDPSALVREHVQWALARHQERSQDSQ